MWASERWFKIWLPYVNDELTKIGFEMVGDANANEILFNDAQNLSHLIRKQSLLLFDFCYCINKIQYVGLFLSLNDQRNYN